MHQSYRLLVLLTLGSIISGGGAFTGTSPFVGIAAGQGWGGEPWYTGADPPPRFEDEIHRSRIFPVPDATVRRAIQLLEYRAMLPLDMAQAAALLPGENLDPEAMVRAEIEEAEAKAQEREGMIRAFPHHEKRFIEEAKEWRARADKARELSGKLRPFLVRGLVLFEGTGGFQVYAREKVLWVMHGSLGSGPVPLRRRPVVAFLAEAPEEVHVSASAGGPPLYPPTRN
jgi:hypothetical protein